MYSTLSVPFLRILTLRVLAGSASLRSSLTESRTDSGCRLGSKKMEKREQRVQKIIELRKEKVEKQKRNIWGMVLITVIVLLMIFIMLYQKKKIVDTMASYDVRYETLQKSIKEEKKHAKEIEKEKEYMQSDEYIAQVAREKLGLVKDNEIVFEEED